MIFIIDLNHDLNRFTSMICITWFKSHQPCLWSIVRSAYTLSSVRLFMSIIIWQQVS